MYVCMCIYICVHTYVYIHTSRYLRLCKYMHKDIYVYVRKFEYVCTHGMGVPTGIEPASPSFWTGVGALMGIEPTIVSVFMHRQTTV